MGEHRRGLLMEAAWCLTLARLRLAVFPYAWTVRRHGTVHSPGEGHARDKERHLTSHQRAIAQEIGWAVDRAARHLPVVMTCLTQATAGRTMLKRRHIPFVMFYGQEKGRKSSEFVTHAWLTAGGIPITGQDVAENFDAFASFFDPLGKY